MRQKYSFRGGSDYINEHFSHLLEDVEKVIVEIDSSICYNKVSEEKTMKGRLLYSPKKLNEQFRIEIVPIKSMADNMSSGVSYFDQFVWDLDKRGVF